MATVGVVGFVAYREVNELVNRRKNAWVNKNYQKEKRKVTDRMSREELAKLLETQERVAFCRCWKSATV